MPKSQEALSEKRLSLISIGEMAKLFNINIRTLRYYDDIGLLQPEYVDQETNYRYYSTGQFERLNTIKYLRALDVSLNKITEFFEERDPDTLLAIFEEQQRDVKNRKAQLDKIERKIDNRITQIKEALGSSFEEISVRRLPERRIVMLEEEFSPTDDIERFIRDLSKEHSLDDAIFLGKIGVSVSKDHLINNQFKNLTAIFIIVEAEDDLDQESITLRGGRYLTIRYQGTHNTAAPHYAKLMKHLKEKGHQPKGNSVEITLIDAGMTNDQTKFVTELQIPF